MTQAELIRFITKRSGVPDFEAKIFFEVFLRKASEMLKPGDAIKLKDVGFFQLKTGKIRNASSAGSGEEDYLFTDLMLFYPPDHFEDPESQKMIFNIPVSKGENYHPVDSFFSLSIGKPVIPLKGVKDTEYFIPPSGNELRKLVETKVQKLLAGVQIVESKQQGNDVLLVSRSFYNPDQYEFKWTETQHAEHYPGSYDEQKPDENASDVEHIAWDFGMDLSRQIEEEAILDTAKEDMHEEKDEDDTDLSWDFGNSLDEENIENKVEPEDNTAENLHEITIDFRDTREINSSEELGSKEGNTSEQDESAEVNTGDDFQRVKSLTSEIESNIDFDEDFEFGEEDDLVTTWDFGNEIIEEPEFDRSKENISEEDDDIINKFPPDTREFKSINSEEEFELDKIAKDTDEKAGETAAENEPELVELDKGIEELPGKSETRRTTTTRFGESTYKRESSAGIFFIALIVIVGVGAALFWFLKNLDSPDKSSAKSGSSAKAETQIINRTYSVPVTYPAEPAGNNAQLAKAGIAPVVLEKASVKEQKIESNSVPAKANTEGRAAKKINNSGTTSNITKPDKPVSKVSGNIYQRNGEYIVQVSSWKSKSIAESEVNRYKKKGYNAFIERARIAGRGIWYRVRVGGFKTLAEAQQFENKNK